MVMTVDSSARNCNTTDNVLGMADIAGRTNLLARHPPRL
jgi:hypothetical protein